MPDPLHIREAGADELDAVVALAGQALGWDQEAPNRALFEWKHRANPFGPTRLWVADDDGELVGLRALMRWAFDRPDGRLVRAVRPVDTATHPDHQGRGIFRRLTEHAVEAERADGVGFVFNTPNDQSRPGYLKMGWQLAGRVRTYARPLHAAAPLRMARSRTPADKWSLPATDGGDPVELLTDDYVAHLEHPSENGLVTQRSAPFLRWRYGLAELAYRVLDADDAAVIYRRRRRGPATELVVADVLAVDTAAAADVIRRLGRLGDADYMLAAGTRIPGTWPLPGQGPLLTTRHLAQPAPRLSDLSLRLGDLELF